MVACLVDKQGTNISRAQIVFENSMLRSKTAVPELWATLSHPSEFLHHDWRFNREPCRT